MSLSITGFLEQAEDTAKAGLAKLIEAKAAEAQARIVQKANPVREAVTAGAVAPVQDPVASNSAPPASGGLSTQALLLIGAAVLAGGFLLLRK